MDYWMIGATLLGPILAVQASMFVDRLLRRRQERLALFKTLMSTRARFTDRRSVEALNLIDITFDGTGKADSAIREAWKLLLDHLGNDKYPKDLWLTKSTEMQIDLLHKMGNALGYPFDKVHLQKQVYDPVIFSNDETAQNELRNLLISVLKGDRPLNIQPFTSNTDIASKR